MPVQQVNLVLMVPVMVKLMSNSKMPGRHLRHKSGIITLLMIFAVLHIFQLLTNSKFSVSISVTVF